MLCCSLRAIVLHHSNMLSNAVAGSCCNRCAGAGLHAACLTNLSARFVVRMQGVIPLAEEHHVVLTDNCVFALGRDMYADQVRLTF